MKMIKNNLLGFIIGIILMSGIGITIAYQISANQISYGDTNVASALTDLYDMASMHCPNGHICTDNEYLSFLGGRIYMVKGATYQGIAYLDPTGNTTDCNEENYVSTTGTKEGCMRFYIYDQDNSYYYAILDHNTTAKVSNWSQAQPGNGTQFSIDTENWDTDLEVRNIRADEVWKITQSVNNQPDWTITDGSMFKFNISSYGWLFSRTSCCKTNGCTVDDNSNNGYWTSQVKSSSAAWDVSCDGVLYNLGISYNDRGIRPIIKISKF